ncbi:MAG: DNA polymerase III subunit delta [Odoribacter sp.]|nr:DNA polymerase III subunit delta [Odoribacter sp.]
MRFEEVIGQKSLCAAFPASLKSGHIAHAQLFSGKTGYGALALALAVAQYLLCENHNESDSCGVCSACRKVAKGVHPDLHFVFPVVKKRESAPISDDYLPQWREIISNPYFGLDSWIEKMGGEENAQPMIYAAESANIIKKLSLKPFEADCRVVVVWLPERMNEECANKLLKILEEPYPGTYFILVSEQPERLLTTIRSRTQTVLIPMLEKGVIAGIAAKSYGMTPERANRLEHLAGGDMVKAIELISGEGNRVENRELFISLMRLCWTRDMVPVNRWVNELADAGREAQKRFLTYATAMLRENFMRNLNREEIIYMTPEEEQFSVRFAPYVNEANILPLFEAMERASNEISRNGNAKIILTDLCIKVMQNIRPTT